MPPDQAEVLRWIEKAEHDRRAVDALLAQIPPITDVAAFHCQQAAEKLLKAVLFAWSVNFEKTHDLRVLCLACADKESAFSNYRDRLASLTAYAVRFRYPGPSDPTVEDVEQARQIVDDLQQFVFRLLSIENK